jgi:hypothetical protein
MKNNAERIIGAFGGATPLAKLLKAPVSTVHKWKSIGISTSRMAHIELVAKQEGVKLPEIKGE